MSTPTKSLPLAIGLNILLPGLGYAYYGRVILGAIIAIAVIYVFLKTPIYLAVVWLSLNVIMLLDMLILSSKHKSSAAAANTKQCPQCAETVQKAALICKHCGHKFT